MGYSSYVSDSQEITFSRALRPLETRTMESVLGSQDWAPYFLQLDIKEETIETDEGTLTRRTASTLSTRGNQGKAYGLEDDLQKLINALPVDVTASGYIERIGEEWPDAERLYVVGRRVIAVKAEIVWPEPS